jgi:hypothetical protein
MLECFVCISTLAFAKKINNIYSYHEMFGTHVTYNNEKNINGILLFTTFYIRTYYLLNNTT